MDAQRAVAAWLEAKLWQETSAMTAAIDEAERSLAHTYGNRNRSGSRRLSHVPCPRAFRES